MESVIKEVKRLSSYTAITQNEFDKLSRQEEFFVPCKMNIDGENINCDFDIMELKDFENIKSERVIDRYRILMNICLIYEKSREYSFPICPQNLYYDFNYNVKVKWRDIRALDESSVEEDFLAQFKSLVGYAMQNKYTYEDYYEGGLDLLKKDKELGTIMDFNNMCDLKQWLFKMYEKENEDIINNRTYVDKKAHKREKSVLNLSIFLLVALSIYSVMMTFSYIPYKESLLKADDAFIVQDYEGVINSMEGIKISKMPKQTKYILAYSYIKSEVLSAQQKKNIESVINPDCEENILNFWIQLGTGDFPNAIDTAKKLGDDELLLYALIKNKQSVINNTTLKGEEKQKKIDELQREIEKITKSLEQVQN